MTDEPTFYPICAHKVTGVHYKYLGESLFENIASGKQGQVQEEDAKKIFRLCPDLSQMCGDFPEVEALLKIGFKLK